MKKIAAVLFMSVLLHAQAFALSGGPVYPGGNFNLTGTYAGVMIPVSADAESVEDLDAEELLNATALGLFTLRVPGSGLATGSFFLFDGGVYYEGVVRGFADVNSGRIAATVSGNPRDSIGFFVSFDEDGVTDSGSIDTADDTRGASGFLTASLVQNNFLSSSFGLLEGEAQVAITEVPGGAASEAEVVDVIDFIVEGVKQSNSITGSPDDGNQT